MIPSLYINIIIIALVIAIIFFSWWNNTPTQKGKRGEARIHKILEQLPDDYHLFKDVVLKTNRGTKQIDHIVISKYGVFVIETKNYRGDIYGNDNRKEWAQLIATDVTYLKKWYKTYTYVTKNKFYNPVKQVYGHVYEIKNNLKEWPNVKVVPIVVFTGNANLQHVHSNNYVIYDDFLLNTIYSYKTIYLSDYDVQLIIDRLTQKNIRKHITNESHVWNIKINQKEFQSKIAAGVCPRCGGNLILRNGKYGRFYGCSHYPNCTFTSTTC